MVGEDLKWKAQSSNNGPYIEEVGPTPLTFGSILTKAEAGRNIELTVDWDCNQNIARLSQDGQFIAVLVGLEAARGLSFFRIAPAATGPDAAGFWILTLVSHAEP